MSNSVLTNNTIKKRLGYIDALRGFTMFLVVFGHVAKGSIGANTVLTSFFLTFRMPTFFFISGFIGYKTLDFWTLANFKNRISKKAFVQIIPCLIFMTLFGYTEGRTTLDMITGHNLWGGYWFTLVLFEMFILYYTISLISNICFGEKIYFILMTFMSIFGVVYLAIGKRNFEIYHIMCFENLFKYFQFFFLGTLFRMYFGNIIKLLQANWFRTFIITFFVILFAYISKFDSNTLPYRIIHDIVIRYVGVCIVFMVFHSLSDFFDKKNKLSSVLQFVGKRTLDIYLLHYFFLPDLKFLKDFYVTGNMLVIEFFTYSILTIGILFICLSTSWIIRRSDTLAYWCFGSKQNK